MYFIQDMGNDDLGSCVTEFPSSNSTNVSNAVSEEWNCPHQVGLKLELELGERG